MIHTKGRFYWRDLLYLSRARDDLRCVQSGHDYDLFQCSVCSSIIRFKMTDPQQQTGKWFRVKPYEFFQLIKLYPSGIHDETKMEKQNPAPEMNHELYRCLQCASYWWKENEEWTRADDEMIEST